MTRHLRSLALAALLALVAGAGAAAPPVGQTSQPLVSENPPVTTFERERLGLVSISGSCSGSLLTNLWVITAAHCVEDDLLSDIWVTGDWRTVEERDAVQVVSLRPADVALIRMNAPMRVFGSERRFEADLWRPSHGGLRGYGARIFGRGRSNFSSPAGPSTRSDGIWRWTDVSITGETALTFTGPTSQTSATRGGDSGGPYFHDRFLVGVHSRSLGVDCPGAAQPCSDNDITSSQLFEGVKVSAVADLIDQALAMFPVPEWGPMVVRRYDLRTDFIRPTVRIENDDYRLDHCLQFGAQCGAPAARAFCQRNEPRFNGEYQFDTEPFGHTGVGETGRTCFGAPCRAFSRISCLTSDRGRIDAYPAPPVIDPDRIRPEDAYRGTGVLLEPPSSSRRAPIDPDRVDPGPVRRPSRVDPDRVDPGPVSRSPRIDPYRANPGPVSRSPADPTRRYGEPSGFAGATDRCIDGFVWREARPGDTVCVTPAVRERTARENARAPRLVDPNGAWGPATCRPGYVWREAFDGDTVCVTPQVRAETREDNRLAASRRR